MLLVGAGKASFTRFESNIILLCAYTAFLSSLAGLVVSVIQLNVVLGVLFAVNLVSISVVKHMYSRRLCRYCEVTTCPFNSNSRV